jgi:hypothetical protein
LPINRHGQAADKLPVIPAAQRHTHRFNQICSIVGLLWLLTAVLWSDRHWSTWQGDFAQFYMGGVMARHGEWNSLYPIPLPGSSNNPGQVEDSTMTPRYAQIAAEVGVGDRLRFIQPPPFALILTPLAWFKYKRAYKIWLLLLIGCTWIISRQSGRIYEMILGRPSRWAGGLSLILMLSPLALASVRGVNMSAMIGACLGAAVIGLMSGQSARPAAAIVFAGLAKYASLPLVPVMVAMHRWKPLAVSAVLGIVIILISLAVMTVTPFDIYLQQIAPTLARPHTNEGNQSLPAFLIRVTHHIPLAPGWSAAVFATRWASFIGLIFLLFCRPVDYWRNPAHICAAAVTMMTWMLIFSPIFWPEYHLYLCPFWGWLLWEAKQSRVRLALVLVAVMLTIVPTPMLAPAVTPRNWDLTLPEPYNTHMLLAAILMLALAIWRLTCRRIEVIFHQKAAVTESAPFNDSMS